MSLKVLTDCICIFCFQECSAKSSTFEPVLDDALMGFFIIHKPQPRLYCSLINWIQLSVKMPYSLPSAPVTLFLLGFSYWFTSPLSLNTEVAWESILGYLLVYLSPLGDHIWFFDFKYYLYLRTPNFLSLTLTASQNLGPLWPAT